MMPCEAVRDKAYEYFLGLLGGVECRELEHHIKSCQDCRDAFDVAARECNLLKRWATPPAPEGLADATIAAARTGARQHVARPAGDSRPAEPERKWLWSRRFWRIAAGLAAAILVVPAVRWGRACARQPTPQETLLYGRAALTPGAPADYRGFVRNGETGEPVPGARSALTLLKDGGELWRVEAVSNDRGFVTFEQQMPSDLPEGAYVLRMSAQSGAGRSQISRTVHVERPFRILVTTDRPIYRPGQRVHVRVLALAAKDLRPVSGRQVEIALRNGEGEAIEKKMTRTSGYGIALAGLRLPARTAVGEHRVTARIDGTSSERGVFVDRYATPRLRVRLATDRTYYAPNGTVRGDVAVADRLGRPLAGTEVRIVAAESAKWSRPFAEAEGKTDARGQFHFELSLGSHFSHKKPEGDDIFVLLEATVTDGSDRAEKRSLCVTVTNRPLRLKLLPESGILVRGVENALYIFAVYPDGRPATARVLVDPGHSRIQTSKAGVAKTQLTPMDPEIVVALVAEHDRVTRARVRRELLVDSRRQSLLLRTDQAVYTPGEAVNLLVLSAEPTGRVFLDVLKSRRTVLMREVELRNGRAELSLQLPPGLFGTLELHAYRILSGGDVVGDTKVILVDRAKELRVATELDKESYRPGDKARLRLSVARADGKPVQAALSLLGLDEEVLAAYGVTPGVEETYFTRDQELLAPARRVGVVSALESRGFAPREKPERRNDAAAAFLSVAEGSASLARGASESFEHHKARLCRAKDARYRELIGAASVLPFGLFALLAVPALIYGVGKLFRQVREPKLSEPQLRALRRSTGGLVFWWAAGLYLPLLVGSACAAAADATGVSGAHECGAIGAGLMAVGVAAVLASFARRLRRSGGSQVFPLLRKITAALPWTYLTGAATVAALAAATRQGILNVDVGRVLLAASALFIVGLLGALSLAGHVASASSSVHRALSLLVGRPALAAVPLVLVGVFLASADHPKGAVRFAAPLFGAAPAVSHPTPPVEPVSKDWEQAEPAARVKTPEQRGSPKRVPGSFRDPLLWQAELVTDAAGQAQLEIPLPDSVANWHIAVSAVSARGELGSARFPLRVTLSQRDNAVPQPR